MLLRRAVFVCNKCYRRPISTTVKLYNKDSSVPPDNIASVTNHSPEHISHDLSQPITAQYTDTLSDGSDAVLEIVPHTDNMFEAGWTVLSDTVGFVVEYLVYPLKWIIGKVDPSTVGDVGSLHIVHLLDAAPPTLKTFYLPWMLDHFQGLTGVPWIFVCAGMTVLIRLALYKLTRRNLWAMYNMTEKMRKIRVLQSSLDYYKSTKNQSKIMEFQQKLHSQSTIAPDLLFILLNMMLMAVPIRCTLKSLAGLQGLSVNEYGWLSDLTVSDPTYILPCVVITAMLTMGYVNVRHHKYFNERTAVLALPFAALGVYALGGVSAVVCQHYAISSCITASLNVSRENEKLRTKLGLPPSEPYVHVEREEVYVKTTKESHEDPDSTPDEPHKVGFFKGVVKQGKRLSSTRKNTKSRISRWFFLRKLQRHGAKGITTEYLDERPAVPRQGYDSIVLVTDVTPELKKYVLRRMHDFKTLKGTEKAIVWIRRVQNKRW